MAVASVNGGERMAMAVDDDIGQGAVGGGDSSSAAKSDL